MRTVLHAAPLALLAGLSILAQGCGSAGASSAPQDYSQVKSNVARNSNPSVPAGDAAALSTGNLEFAFNLYPGIATDETSNVFYSPYSASLALAMTYAGMANATATQTAQAMDFTLPADRLHAAFDALDLALESRGQGQPGTHGQPFQLSLADSLWGDKTLTFETPFLDTLAVDYGAGLQVTDFVHAPEQARDTINGWVSDKTDQKIPTLLPDGSIDSSTRFVLVNAVYFDAAWASQFTVANTAPAAFTRLDGSTVQATEMNQENEFSYYEGDGYQAVELPYAGDQVSMVVILPAAGQFSAVEKSLSGATLGTVFAGLQIADVTLGLPKFKVHAPTFSLAKQLQKLGMVDAFDPTKADMSAMLGPNSGVFIGDVLQQAYVSVDEQGTEAAAATAVIGVGTAAPGKSATVLVNRPFFFVIRDVATETALFVGRVLDPTQ